MKDYIFLRGSFKNSLRRLNSPRMRNKKLNKQVIYATNFLSACYEFH